MLKQQLIGWLFLSLLLIPSVIQAQCNGSFELCDKQYNQVSHLTTHNAFNAEEDGFNLPNQTYGLTRQLNDGVRALMLDVYDEGGVATVYHGFSFLGTTTLVSNLTEIKDFLVANPNEVVTLLFETYISANMMDAAMTQVGLKEMLHVQTLDEPWPTLQEMIDADKRLVFFSDHNNAETGQDWYHYMWDFIVETDFENNALSDFSCDLNRGNAANDLFILNHFATDATLGTGRTDLSEQANEFNYFVNRAIQCWSDAGKFPNFPTVDFYELGDCLEVIDSLNARVFVGIEEKSNEDLATVFPNPSNGNFTLNWNRPLKAQISVYNIAGERLSIINSSSTSVEVMLDEFPAGIYHVLISTESGAQALKLVNL